MNINELKANTVAIAGPDGRALIVREDAQLRVSWTMEAITRRDLALGHASEITSVTSQAELDLCVQAHVHVRTVRTEAERARKECKQPILDFGRAIDASAKQFDTPLDQEDRRLSRLAGDYMAIVEANRKAAEALRLADLADIERRKQEQLAHAHTIEEIDEIQAQACEEAREASVPIEAIRAEGQVVREDWEITVTNSLALAVSHPGCVRMVPNITEIKALLNAGVRLAGIEARRIVNSTVRTAKRQEPLRIS